MFPESHGFVIYAGYKLYQRYMLQFIPIESMKGDEIVRHFDWHSNGTLTIGKHITKYKSMRKWMDEFLRKFENPGIKIARVNSILITKSLNLPLITLIFQGVGGPL